MLPRSVPYALYAPNFAEYAFWEVRCLQATPSSVEEMAAWRIYVLPPCYLRRYSEQGRGSEHPFFLRPTTERGRTMKKRILVLLSVVILMLAMAVPAFAAPGDHDSTIGRDASSTNQLGKAFGYSGAGGDVVSDGAPSVRRSPPAKRCL